MAGVGELWQGAIQVGKETSYGVPVAATRIVYVNGNPTLTKTKAPRPRMVATGNRYNQRAFTLGPNEVGGSFEIPLSASEILEWAAAGIAGGVTPTTPTGATNGRLWSYVGGASALDSMTIEFNDGAASYRAYGVYVNELRIAGEANGPQTVTVSLFGVDRAGNALTGALSSRVPTIVEGYETLCFVDTFGGVMGSTLQMGFLQKWDITYSNGLQRKYLAENRNAMKRAITAPMSLKASLTIEAAAAQSAVEIADWEAATKRHIQLQFGYNATNAIETGIAQLQTISQVPTPSAGTFKLTILGVQTGTIAYNANAATIKAAIEAVTTVAFDATATVTVGGGPLPGTPVTVTFSGAFWGKRNIPVMLVDNTLVTGGTFTVANTTPGYSGNEGITIDMPGFWDSADLGQTDAGTRVYAMGLDYLYDPTNAIPFRMQALCGRATAF